MSTKKNRWGRLPSRPASPAGSPSRQPERGAAGLSRTIPWRGWLQPREIRGIRHGSSPNPSMIASAARIDAILLIDGVHTAYLNGKTGPKESTFETAPLDRLVAVFRLTAGRLGFGGAGNLFQDQLALFPLSWQCRLHNNGKFTVISSKLDQRESVAIPRRIFLSGVGNRAYRFAIILQLLDCLQFLEVFALRSQVIYLLPRKCGSEMRPLRYQPS